MALFQRPCLLVMGASLIAACGAVEPPPPCSIARGNQFITGFMSHATAINNLGQVVGYSDDANLERQAFLWYDGVMQDLSATSDFDQATAINDRGVVIGKSTTPQGSVRAWVRMNGGPIDIESDNATAMRINERDQILVRKRDRGFLWTDGDLEDLGDLGGRITWPSDFNDSGQVVGTSFTSSGERRAFLWEDGAMQDLWNANNTMGDAINNRGQITGRRDRRAVFGGIGTFREVVEQQHERSYAYILNEAGQVAGDYTPGSGRQAYVWQDGVMRLIDNPPGTELRVNDMNRHGHVVGSILIYDASTDNEERTAFYWDGAEFYRLPDFGGTYTRDERDWDRAIAAAINDNGQIVGSAINVHGFQTAVLWEDGVIRDLGTLALPPCQ